MALRVGVPVEQFWHRIPGGTGRATRETLLALADPGLADPGLADPGMADPGMADPGPARDDPARDDPALGPDQHIATRLVAAWHRPGRRQVPAVADLGPIRFAPLPRPVLYEAWLRLGRPRLETWTGPVDVVWAAAMVVPACRAPVVATVHDLGFLDHPERSSRRGRSFFPRAWDTLCQRATLVVCPSRVVADDCRRWGMEPGRLRVVPWGVGAPLSGPGDADLVRRARRLPERFVLWVGTLEPRKNLPGLVEAVRRLPDAELVVVGPDGWEIDGRDVLAPLGPRAHRLGPVDDVELSALYRAASVFAFPSLLEGFGLPVLEAMVHGTPVVTSAGTATAEVAGGAARLVDPGDPGALAEAIGAALSGDATTRALAAAGLARARQLSWAATAAGYSAVWRDAVAAGAD